MADTPNKEPSLADKYREKIKENPITHVLIGAGVGLVIGYLLAGMAKKS